jgi:hypothetical protein
VRVQQQLGEQRARGVELSVSARPYSTLQVMTDVTFLDDAYLEFNENQTAPAPASSPGRGYTVPQFPAVDVTPPFHQYEAGRSMCMSMAPMGPQRVPARFPPLLRMSGRCSLRSPFGIALHHLTLPLALQIVVDEGIHL